MKFIINIYQLLPPLFKYIIYREISRKTGTNKMRFDTALGRLYTNTLLLVKSTYIQSNRLEVKLPVTNKTKTIQTPTGIGYIYIPTSLPCM